MEWRVHIGAHKTATTHLQDLLAANRVALAQQGVQFYPRELIRRSGLIRAVHSNFFSQDWVRRKCIDEIVPAKTKEWRAALISEENIIGISAQLLQGFYPTVVSRLLPWASIMPPEKTHVFLGIRNQADILPSAYSQALRDGSLLPPFRDILENWRQTPPSWYSLSLSVRQLFADSSLEIWSFEDYIKYPAGILRRLGGISHVDVEQIPVARETRMLTAAAVSAVEKLDPAPSPEERRKRVMELAERYADTDPYAPLSAADHRFFTDIYYRDLERLHDQHLLLSL